MSRSRHLLVLALTLSLGTAIAGTPKNRIFELTPDSDHKVYAEALTTVKIDGGFYCRVRGKNGWCFGQDAYNQLVWTGYFLRVAMADMALDDADLRRMTLEYYVLYNEYKADHSVYYARPTFIARMDTLFKQIDTYLASSKLGLTADQTRFAGAIKALELDIDAKKRMLAMQEQAILSHGKLSTVYDSTHADQQKELDLTQARISEVRKTLDVQYLAHWKNDIINQQNTAAKHEKEKAESDAIIKGLRATEGNIKNRAESDVDQNLPESVRKNLIDKMTSANLGLVNTELTKYTGLSATSFAELEKTNYHLNQSLAEEKAARENIGKRLGALKAKHATTAAEQAALNAEKEKVVAQYANIAEQAKKTATSIRQAIVQSEAELIKHKTWLRQTDKLLTIMENEYFE